jgi:hypothetical protein
LIEVDANLFRAADVCRSHEETRYYLNGVYISPHPEKGVLLTATDGHRLICLHDEEGECSAPRIVCIHPKAIDQRAVTAYRKAMSSGSPKVVPKIHIVIDDDGIATVGTYRSLKSCFIDGTYPDWSRVVNPVLAKAKDGKYVPASYNQKYIAEFGQIATLLSPDNNRNASIRIVSFDEADPSLIRFGSVDNAFGIVMPMRAVISNDLPVFMKPILEPTPAAQPSAAATEAAPESPRAKAKVKTAAKKRPPTRRQTAKRKPVGNAKKPARRRAA